MAQSRLERIGTIFSRVSNLIRTGAMNMNDRPVWYDVYRAFPPTVPPKFDRVTPKMDIGKIFYKEDVIRARFHQEMKRSLPATNLKDSKFLTVTQNTINMCNVIQREKNISLDEAYHEAFHLTKLEASFKQNASVETHNSDLTSTFKAALMKGDKVEQPLNVKVKDILSDDR